MSLHLSKYHTVDNHMSRLKYMQQMISADDIPCIASTGIFPSGEELCTTGETTADISRHKDINSDMNHSHKV